MKGSSGNWRYGDSSPGSKPKCSPKVAPIASKIEAERSDIKIQRNNEHRKKTKKLSF